MSAKNLQNFMCQTTEGTGVSMISDGTQVICKVYDTTGIYLGSVETLKKDAAEAIKNELNLQSGIYLLVFNANGTTETIKLQF